MKKIDEIYTGDIAQEYDARRANSARWQREAAIFHPLLLQIPSGSTVLDIAAGTGRWLPIYKELNVHPILLDSSADMLSHAKRKADELGLPISLLIDSATKDHPFPRADWAVATSFFNWISLREVESVLEKAVSAGAHGLIFNIVYMPTDTSEEEAERARVKIDQKNLQSRLGRRKKGIMHFHTEPQVREMFVRVGVVVSREDIINDSPGWRGVAFLCLSKSVIDRT